MENQQKNKIVHWFIIGTFVTLYVLVSLISTIHVIDFFELSNYSWLAITLAIAFEVGAAASLASLIVLSKMNKWIVWALFFTLTLMQAMGNTYFAFTHLHDYQGWVELFGLNEEDPLYQKRILSIVSGAILPLVALGFIKSLVDYIKPSEEVEAAPPAVEAAPPKEEPVEIEEPVKDLDKIKAEAEKKTLVDIASFMAALEMANAQREAVVEEAKAEETPEPELITDIPEQPEFMQIPVVDNIEDIQPKYEEPVTEEPQRYAQSYSVDDLKAENEIVFEEKKTL
jgi:hypothetical protein